MYDFQFYTEEQQQASEPTAREEVLLDQIEALRAENKTLTLSLEKADELASFAFITSITSGPVLDAARAYKVTRSGWPVGEGV